MIDQPGRYAPEPPPAAPLGVLAWMRTNLFQNALSTATTVALLCLLAIGCDGLLRWAVLDAIWTLPGARLDDTSACRQAGVGACWAVVAEKYRFILFGLYPFEEQWRPAASIAVFLALFAASTRRQWWGWPLLVIWVAGFTLAYGLLAGGIFGLTAVSEDRWGGLPITLLLASSGIALAFPLAILVAVGRLSDNPALRLLCRSYVEIIRGVPLISVLFLASVLFPLFLPDGMHISKLLRAQVAIVIFIAAYLAELIRGGLQALGRGQTEAATALGLGYWRTLALIRLPQALALALPPIVSLFIGFFKNTSLVMTIGIFDLLNAAKSAVAEPAWQGFGTEAYLFAGAIYFAFCFAMSRYGLGLERRLTRER